MLSFSLSSPPRCWNDIHKDIRMEEKNEAKQDDVRSVIVLKHGSRKINISGTVYMLQEDMSVARYEYFDQLWPRFVFGVDYQTHQAEIAKASNALLYAKSVQASIYECATILTNLYRNMTAVSGPSRAEVALEICALIFNTEGEDTTGYDDSLLEKKKADFRKCNASFFLTTAAACIPGLIADLQALPETIQSLTTMLDTLQSTRKATFGESTERTIGELKALKKQ